MASWYTDSYGYRRFSDSGRLVHRWVAEKKVGGRLFANQVVHHKNRDKGDNRPGNLWVFNSQKAHNRVHWSDKRCSGVW